MEEKREQIYQKLEELKSALLDAKESQARLLHYHPEKATTLSQKINDTQSSIALLQKELNKIDLEYIESIPAQENQRQKTPLEQLVAVFHEGEKVLQAKRTFLHYLLGRHPQAILATLIQEGAAFAKKIETDHPQLRALLESFIKDAENPWNKNLYRGGFLDYGKKIESLLKDSI